MTDAEILAQIHEHYVNLVANPHHRLPQNPVLKEHYAKSVMYIPWLLTKIKQLEEALAMQERLEARHDH